MRPYILCLEKVKVKVTHSLTLVMTLKIITIFDAKVLTQNIGEHFGEWYKKDHNMPECGSFNGVLLFDNSIVWPLSLPACKCAVDGGAKPLHWWWWW